MKASAVERWLKQAEADLETAQSNFTTGHYYAAALFAQQAAEKALKAVIIDRTNDLAPRIHDLVGLGELAQVSQDLKQDLAQLDPAYMDSRYPDADQETIPAESYTAEETKPLLQMGAKVVSWAKRQI